MATGQLSWDYGDTTGESSALAENSPLLNGLTGNAGTFYSINSDPQGCKLTQKQVSFLLRNLESSASLLRAYLREMEQTEGTGDDHETVQPRSLNVSRCCPFSSRIKTILTSNVLVSTLVLQALNIAILSIIDALPESRRREKSTVLTGCVVMIVLEVVNMIVIFFTTVTLTKQMINHNVRGVLLAASYIATILIFAGIYMTTFRLDKSSWKAIADDFLQEPVAIDLYVKMVYLSVSTATLCGSCSVTPKKWFNYSIMSLQMLLSFLYFAQILAQVMPSHQPIKHPTENVDSQEMEPGSPTRQRQRSGSIASQTSRQSAQGVTPNRSPRNHMWYGSTS